VGVPVAEASIGRRGPAWRLAALLLAALLPWGPLALAPAPAQAAAPVLASLSPSSALAGGPTFTLDVFGSGSPAFNSSRSRVKWNGSKRTTTFVDGTHLRAQITAADIAGAGTANVTVQTTGGGGGTSNPLVFVINNPTPVLTSVSPTSATAGDPALTLTVEGSGFNGASVVRWNGSTRTTKLVSSTRLTATIGTADLATPGSFAVTVFNPTPPGTSGGGTSAPATFTVLSRVGTIASLSPSAATAGDPAFPLTADGSGFGPSTYLVWNGTPITPTTFVSATRLTAQVPAALLATGCLCPVIAFTPGPGGGASNTVDFTVNNPAPAISSLSATSAAAGGAGFALTVSGTGFVPGGGSGGSAVQWAGAARATTYVSPTQLTAQITAADLSTGGVFVVTVANPAPGGGVSNALYFTVNNPAPAISSLGPSSATAGDPDFTLTIYGSGFVPAGGSGGSLVFWDGAPRPTGYISSTQLQADIGAADVANAGLAGVTVGNPSPGGGTSNVATFAINLPPSSNAPVITDLSPISTNAGGPAFTLAVTGLNFDATAKVLWNGSIRTTSFVSSTRVTAQIPAPDIAVGGTYTITVQVTGGASSNAAFTVYNPAPVLNSLSPSAVAAGSGGFVLTVNGASFVAPSANGAPVVQWNGSARPTTYVNSGQLTASIDAADVAIPGSATVTVVNPVPGGGGSNALSLAIASTNPTPAITGLSPSSTTAGGTAFTLTVNGSGFVPAVFSGGSVVQWNGAPRPTTYVGSAQLQADIGAADIAIPGLAGVTVVNPAPGGASNVATFFIGIPTGSNLPVIAGLNPSSASAGGPGFTLAITGLNFDQTAQVLWNGSGRPTTFVSSTQVTARIGASDIATAGTFTVTVQVSTPGGGAFSNASFSVFASGQTRLYLPLVTR
jgi:hypothetical protein